MKRDYWLDGPYFWGASGDEWQSACFTEHLDYWTPEHTNAYYPKPYFGNIKKNQEVQSGYLQNAAYLRVKNVQVGYTLPKSWTKTLGGDWGPGKLYPLQRTLSVGVNVNF